MIKYVVDKKKKAVNASIHKSQIASDDVTFAKIQRNTVHIGSIIERARGKDPSLPEGVLFHAANLIHDGIIDLAAEGNAIDLLGLGTLYLKPDGAMTGESLGDIPPMTVGFTPSAELLDAVKPVTVTADVTKSTVPAVLSVFDFATQKTDGTLTAGHAVRLKGNNLKVAGNEADVGIFFAPVGQNNAYNTTGADWIQLKSNSLADNTSGRIEFNLPASVVAGKYRLAIKTAYGGGTRLNKTVRMGMYDGIITVV